jgi:virulence factor Mce-like protein
VNRQGSSLAASPVVIGAATVLVAIVAMFLAYNANQGLPFVPTYQVKAHVPNAAALVRGNEVRVAGIRVGTITRIAPVRERDGRYSAELTLSLERRLAPLPVDSTFIVRSRSALGLKYLQLTIGRARRTFPERATIPLANARPEPVEIDQVLNAFDEPTRRSAAANLDTLGTALAGRGEDIGETVGALRTLAPRLERVMRRLAEPDTRLGRFFAGLQSTASAIAPAAEDQAGLFRGLETTFAAVASVTRPYVQEALAEGPETFDVATRSLRSARPFLGESERLVEDLRPAVASLRRAAPPLGRAFERGAPVLRQARGLNRRLEPLLESAGDLGGDPLAVGGLRDLAALGPAARPLVGSLQGMQETCNYVTLLFRNLASALSDGDAVGTWLRFLIVLPPGDAQRLTGPNSEGAPAAAPADRLHANPYPHVGAPGRPRECEAGHERYAAGRRVLGNPPGDQGTRHDVTRREP